jgi:hypothetical protein
MVKIRLECPPKPLTLARVGVLALVAGCGLYTASDSPVSNAFQEPRLALASADPGLVVDVQGLDVSNPTASALLDRADAALRRADRQVRPAAAPLLSNTAWGRAWVEDGRPGAIARGSPPERCPALGVALGASRIDAIGAAVDQCRAGLEAAGARDCGCQLLALDDRLLAPLEAFAYAPGTTGRLVGLGGGLAAPLVARERTVGPAPTDIALSFSTARREVARATLSADGDAVLTLADGRRFVGRRELEGWRRGRLTERLLLRDAAGKRLIALIGFEPTDFAREGDRLARWPSAAPG